MTGIIMIMFANTLLHAIISAPSPALVAKRFDDISFNPDLRVDSEENREIGLPDSPTQPQIHVDEPSILGESETTTPEIEASDFCTKADISTDLTNINTTNDLLRRQTACPANMRAYIPEMPVVASPPTFQRHHPKPNIGQFGTTKGENPCTLVFQSMPAMPKLIHVSCGGPTQGGSKYSPHLVVNCVAGESSIFLPLVTRPVFRS